MVQDYGQKLIEETEKWTEKIKARMDKTALIRSDKKDFLENINAYIKDSAYFLEKNDLVRAFEAIVWAWSWLEIGISEGILSDSSEND